MSSKEMWCTALTRRGKWADSSHERLLLPAAGAPHKHTTQAIAALPMDCGPGQMQQIGKLASVLAAVTYGYTAFKDINVRPPVAARIFFGGGSFALLQQKRGQI